MIPKSAFFRENFVATLGIVLPLLLVAVFAFARYVGDTPVAAPQYKAVYAWTENNRGGRFLYETGPDKKLAITFKGIPYNGKELPRDTSATVTIFVMDVNTGEVTRHTYDVANAYVEGVNPVDTKDLSVVLASQGTLSPDGYVFVRERQGDDYYSGGFVPDLFGYNRRNSRANVIIKGSSSFPLDTTDAQGRATWNNIEFIGWTKD